MKLNISSPQNGTNITLEVTGNAERIFHGKSLGDIIDGSMIKQEYAGWKMLLTGGSDKQGFPMDTQINTDKRQRLLRRKGDIGFKPRRKGELRRKSVRGAIISEETSALCMKVVNDLFAEKEENKTACEPCHIEGLTDRVADKTHLPKRFNKLKAALGLKDVDVSPEEVKDAIIKALPPPEEGKKRKLPKIRMTRIKHEFFSQRYEKKQEISRARREKSEKIRQEFFKKYPDWLASK
ncbi:40S ribosomal protein S6 [Trachipleistophora hominis]|uniref:40S ribosomal protein S6 n=1 Tax=Trachipleistophora hominis TaxID=72359 RepID=L7JSM0_TRAHO|nr:40S ribosomal protein S6 [Trachipleistophora hominis]